MCCFVYYSSGQMGTSQTHLKKCFTEGVTCVMSISLRRVHAVEFTTAICSGRPGVDPCRFSSQVAQGSPICNPAILVV